MSTGAGGTSYPPLDVILLYPVLADAKWQCEPDEWANAVYGPILLKLDIESDLLERLQDAHESAFCQRCGYPAAAHDPQNVSGPPLKTCDRFEAVGTPTRARRIRFECGHIKGEFELRDDLKMTDVPVDIRARATALCELLLRRGAPRSFLLGRYGPLFLLALAEHPDIARLGTKVLLLPQSNT